MNLFEVKIKNEIVKFKTLVSNANTQHGFRVASRKHHFKNINNTDHGTAWK